MHLRGKLHAESPIYRGNARKTLFTRDHDGKERLVSLAGEIRGTAQSLMDAFIGSDKRGRNRGLLNRLWERLYDSPLPKGLIRGVDCQLEKTSYPRDHFFDLRMGIKLDEDRWAAEANANYKYETLFRNSVFDFQLSVNDNVLKQGDNAAKLYYLLQELREGRFWFGAGKSKGLGRCRLEIKLPFGPPQTPPKIHPGANHLNITLTFDAANPVLVGWNWGKVDPETPSFAAIEGRLLLGAMRDLPAPIRERLAMTLGGPILNPKDWKNKLSNYLPRVIAIWLREQSIGKTESWTIPAAPIAKMKKGKYALSKKVIAAIEPLIDQPFSSRDALESSLLEALDDKANMAKRILKVVKSTTQTTHQFSQDAWAEVTASLGVDAFAEQVAAQIDNEAALTKVLTTAIRGSLPRLYEQIDQQVKLLQSDAWVDIELTNREEHLLIKQMIMNKKITERDWGNWNRAPAGVSAAGWREFLAAHRRVRFHHLRNPRNLNKSIVNDQNFITFLKSYRNKTRQELAQPHNIDFRRGGVGNREISKKYGKPYDTVFMRMLSWAPSSQGDGAWEAYIPGSTIKGAFRKRATQVLKTLWGETGRTKRLIERLFGAQRQVGMAFFSDAYLMDPYDPKSAWCSMDGVKMNPKTGRPVEAAKADYLFAYGNRLVFQLRIDIQDVDKNDLEAISLLAHLIQDFQSGDVPLGGAKTDGFGWVPANVSGLTWLAGSAGGVGAQLFSGQQPTPDGVWQKLTLDAKSAVASLRAMHAPLASGDEKVSQDPPRAQGGFISHRAFGGHCGVLEVEAEVLTPLSIRESGEPSFRSISNDGHINGWDFFSMSPPENAHRETQREYALPSKSLKGMIRHIYAITSDSRKESPNINNLTPVDSLLGFVGKGPNQAIMGRLAISFGPFENPELAWFKTPYPYGNWQFNGKWQKVAGGTARSHRIADTWRVFPHAPLAPIVRQLDDFQPDTSQASYFRAILPGSRARFHIRFWNLAEEELQRLVWCLTLEDGMAHKMGGSRYIGFGSLRLHIRPESYLIDWAARYAGKSPAEWKHPIQVGQWRNAKVVFHHRALRQALDAGLL
ncbi:MAG: RAMP superfamily CRISPR-associated protein [Anaerolineales bacterium]